ncbi:hypothetical protein DFJ74DRAFT_112006 [Hyaloraphidium curvatum]|nr:hypothetical protein DFJ74DRAFT_112006 [Hyaloraphidium curvatum]
MNPASSENERPHGLPVAGEGAVAAAGHGGRPPLRPAARASPAPAWPAARPRASRAAAGSRRAAATPGHRARPPPRRRPPRQSRQSPRRSRRPPRPPPPPRRRPARAPRRRRLGRPSQRPRCRCPRTRNLSAPRPPPRHRSPRRTRRNSGRASRRASRPYSRAGDWPAPEQCPSVVRLIHAGWRAPERPKLPPPHAAQRASNRRQERQIRFLDVLELAGGRSPPSGAGCSALPQGQCLAGPRMAQFILRLPPEPPSARPTTKTPAPAKGTGQLRLLVTEFPRHTRPAERAMAVNCVRWLDWGSSPPDRGPNHRPGAAQQKPTGTARRRRPAPNRDDGCRPIPDRRRPRAGRRGGFPASIPRPPRRSSPPEPPVARLPRPRNDRHAFSRSIAAPRCRPGAGMSRGRAAAGLPSRPTPGPRNGTIARDDTGGGGVPRSVPAGRSTVNPRYGDERYRVDPSAGAAECSEAPPSKGQPAVPPRAASLRVPRSAHRRPEAHGTGLGMRGEGMHGHPAAWSARQAACARRLALCVGRPVASSGGGLPSSAIRRRPIVGTRKVARPTAPEARASGRIDVVADFPAGVHARASRSRSTITAGGFEAVLHPNGRFLPPARSRPTASACGRAQRTDGTHTLGRSGAARPVPSPSSAMTGRRLRRGRTNRPFCPPHPRGGGRGKLPQRRAHGVLHIGMRIRASSTAWRHHRFPSTGRILHGASVSHRPDEKQDGRARTGRRKGYRGGTGLPHSVRLRAHPPVAPATGPDRASTRRQARRRRVPRRTQRR